MRFNFSTFAEFVDFGANEGSFPKEQRHAHATSKYFADFTGTKDMSAAVDLARNGWEAGREKAEAMRAHFAHIVGSKAKRAFTAYEVAGYAPCVPEFLAGNPECMAIRQYEEVEAAGRIIRIVFNGTASCGMSHETIIARGALACALVDAIEAAGSRVEIDLCFISSARGASSDVFVALKQPEEPVEMDKLAFALAHPSSLRRLAFSVWEHDLPFMRKNWSDNGRCVEAEAQDRGDIYIGSADLRQVSDAEAVAWAKQQLAKVGITFEAH